MWFVIIPRKLPEVKLWSQEDKQVLQTWKLYFKISRSPANFFSRKLKKVTKFSWFH